MIANPITLEYEGYAPANSRQARMLMREAINKAWEGIPFTDDQFMIDGWGRRVSGQCICSECGMFYSDHPNETREKTFDGNSCLTRLCEVGILVKL